MSIMSQCVVITIFLGNGIFYFVEFNKETAVYPLMHRYVYLAILASLYAWFPTFRPPSQIISGAWNNYGAWSAGITVASIILDFAYSAAINVMKLREQLRYYCIRIEEQWKSEAFNKDGNAQLELVELHLNELGSRYDVLKPKKPQADMMALEWLIRAQKNPDPWTRKEFVGVSDRANRIITTYNVERELRQIKKRFFGNFNAEILSFDAREDGTGCMACPHH